MPHDNRYPFYIQCQYIKDLSFENQNFLLTYSNIEERPEVNVSVNTNTTRLGDDRYEVLMTIIAKSSLAKNPLFVIELVYAGVVLVEPGLGNDTIEPIMTVHCPFLMFPFVREIVTNLTCAGGYPPLIIEPIDFAALYLEKNRPSAQPDAIPDAAEDEFEEEPEEEPDEEPEEETQPE
jgi:preprotein translocase subunit SecB